MKKTNLKSDCHGKPAIETVDGRYFCGGVNGCGRYCKTTHNLRKSTQNLGNLPKTIDCWIEMLNGKHHKADWPTIWFKKPTARELENNKEFGYKTYKCTIVLMEEI